MHCKTNAIIFIKWFGAHGHVAFLTLMWLTSRLQHSLCLNLNVLDTHCFTAVLSDTHKSVLTITVLRECVFSWVKLRPSECHTGDTSSEDTPQARRNTPFTARWVLRCSPERCQLFKVSRTPGAAHLSQTPLCYHHPATLSVPSETVTFQFFILIAICCCSTAGLYANCVYATNIFLQFKCLIQPFICCQQNIKACKVLEPDKTVWKDEDYNYCHRCPTKPAVRCFPSLCLPPNVTTCRLKMKRWGHRWSSLTTSCILSYF